ncbi:DUF1983 domain-containing protein [Enterobacter hormaechei]
MAYRKDPTFNGPEKLKYLLDNADGAGTSIYQQSQLVAENVLEVAREGLYVDYAEASDEAIILRYPAENIINWRTKRINGRDQLVLVVLRECVEEPDGYAYKDEIQYRELALEEGRFICRVWRRAGGTASGTYTVDSEYHPKPKGKDYWDEIPFTFVGAQNNDPTIDDSPLAALVEINHGHYRNSADYEDSVWFCGQVQPYMTGLDTGWRDHLEKKGVKIGSRSPLLLPKEGSFGYAQAQPNMLAKEAMDSKRDYMVQLGARLIEQNATVKTATQASGDSNEKIAGMADDIKQANDELAQQAQEIAKNAQDIGKVQTSVTNLSSTVGDVSSSLSELEQTVATADTALGQRIDNISVSVDGMTGGVKNSAIAIIQGNLAQVAARKTLSASVAGNSAQLDRIDEVIVNEKEATARSLLSLQTDVNGNKASINSLNQTFSDYQQATATQINGITATINGHTSAITTNAQAIANVNGDLKAMYSIKVGLSSNGQYYAAGMGIGVENTPSGMQSQVIFLADRFAVTHQAGATVTLPFVIQNGQVFIRDALIGDGTISNAKIGNYIQSNNYVAGSVGWRLDKGGTFENYGSTAGEGAMKQTNQTISVRDSRNVLRVQIGRITGTW